MNKICMNLGTVDDKGSLCLLPFHIIDGILVQYTFGVSTSEESIDFDSFLGRLKLELFQAITKQMIINTINSSDKEFIKATMIKRLEYAKSINVKCVLFVIKKGDDGDVPFYEAFSIDKDCPPEIVYAEDLDLTVEEPFFIFPKEEM